LAQGLNSGWSLPFASPCPLTSRSLSPGRMFTTFFQCCCTETPSGEAVTIIQTSPSADEPGFNALDAEDSISLEPDAEFMVIELEKNDDIRKLGIDVDVDYEDGTTMLITRVKEGLIMQWNDNNPEKEVKVGHILVEVNGVKGKSSELLATCGRNDHLTLTIKTA